MSILFSTKRYCNDNNPKVVTRIYNWDEKIVEINLCEKCRNDPDFVSFISEFHLNIKKELEGLRVETIPSSKINATEAT